MFSKYAVALTGSIGTGKSTACTMLKLLGFYIIDTDTIAHKLLDKHNIQITNLFGQNVSVDNKIDRKKLGSIVFNDKNMLNKLEKFIHPLIHQEVLRLSRQQDKYKKPYLIDIPLFFEKGSYDIEKSIVVYTPREIQLQRLMKRDNLTQEEALKRASLQLDIQKKKELATYVIDNSKDLSHLHSECEKVKRELIKDVY